MKTIKNWLSLILITFLLLAGCKKEEIVNEEEEKDLASALTLNINSFIKSVMTDIYLWYDKIPAINIKYETDSKAYFNKLLYNEDKWSIITDDVTTLENGLQGIETTYGYSLAFGQFVNTAGAPTGNYFGIVEYVYPNTPASKADFTRGDIIIQLNGENITAYNYMNLFSGTSISVTKGILTNGSISTGTTVSLIAEELDLDPVLMYKIIERAGHKIGYLLYLQFISSYDSTSLYRALQNFKDNQITDLVLDLRYNPGGQTSAAQYLCSSIAPLNNVNGNSTLVTYQWNDKYQAYWISRNWQEQLGITFNSNVPVKLGLSKVHILTGKGTASASELTICGLEPYMDVTLVGDDTYGKYTASTIIKPEYYYTNVSDYTDFKDWGLMPIILRYANSLGITNFTNGFEPDFQVNDALLPAYPLGELTEPLLKKAVENITGETITDLKKAGVSIKFNVVDRGFSKLDPQKRNLFIEIPRNFQKISE
jgi:C-terminal processing protease CtpA/Prc